MNRRRDIINEIIKEREHQDAKWGKQNHHPVLWLAILSEEVGEASKAALEAYFNGYELTGNYKEYRDELIQVAAVALAMIEALDRNDGYELVCRVCGCTQNNPCKGGCYWVEPDLCSKCHKKQLRRESNERQD